MSRKKRRGQGQGIDWSPRQDKRVARKMMAPQIVKKNLLITGLTDDEFHVLRQVTHRVLEALRGN